MSIKFLNNIKKLWKSEIFCYAKRTTPIKIISDNKILPTKYHCNNIIKYYNKSFLLNTIIRNKKLQYYEKCQLTNISKKISYFLFFSEFYCTYYWCNNIAFSY